MFYLRRDYLELIVGSRNKKKYGKLNVHTKKTMQVLEMGIYFLYSKIRIVRDKLKIVICKLGIVRFKLKIVIYIWICEI